MTHVTALSIFAPPYRFLQPFAGDAAALRREVADRPGVCLLWRLEGGWRERVEIARARPGGVALIVVLPPAEAVSEDRDVLRMIETCRPHSVLPYHPGDDVEDLRQLVRRPPDDLPAEITDYLAWRGVVLDQDTRHLVRRTVEMSGEVRTVAALARGLYQSRRALGRRLLNAGLPVASHWLHFARVLRAAIRLQAGEDGLFTVACDLGYPDGFALSNQMKRLTGLRPTAARDYLGWEWILETWLQREAQEGHLGEGIAPIFIRPERPHSPRARTTDCGRSRSAQRESA